MRDVGVDERVVYECIFGKWGGKAWIGLIWLRIGVSCKHGNEPGGIKGREFAELVIVSFSRWTIFHGCRLETMKYCLL
jgi:hypothetical protein